MKKKKRRVFDQREKLWIQFVITKLTCLDWWNLICLPSVASSKCSQQNLQIPPPEISRIFPA